MKSLYAHIFAFIAVAICFSTPAYAQRGSIVGVVLDKEGKPLSGASVTFDRDEVKYHVEVKTDKNGNYSRQGLEDGTYRVTVVQDGKPVTSSDVEVALSFRVDKNFDLRTAGAPLAAGTAAPAMSKAQQDAEKKLNSETGGAYNAGLTALNAKNFDEAVKQLSAAAQKQPKSYLIFARLAEANAGARKNGEAIDAYKKAIELKGDEPDYHFKLGMLYVQTQATADAAAQFDKYLQLAPKGENAAMAKQLSDAMKASK